MNSSSLILKHMFALIRKSNLAERMDVCMKAYFLFRIIRVKLQVFQWCLLFRVYSLSLSGCNLLLQDWPLCPNLINECFDALGIQRVIYNCNTSPHNKTCLFVNQVHYSHKMALFYSNSDLCECVERWLSKNHVYLFHHLFYLNALKEYYLFSNFRQRVCVRGRDRDSPSGAYLSTTYIKTYIQYIHT